MPTVEALVRDAGQLRGVISDLSEISDKIDTLGVAVTQSDLDFEISDLWMLEGFVGDALREVQLIIRRLVAIKSKTAGGLTEEEFRLLSAAGGGDA